MAQNDSKCVENEASEPVFGMRWIEKMRGDEEGDELVILALSRLCGMAVQPAGSLN